MASPESNALKELMISMNERMASNPDMGLDGLRALTDELATLTAEPDGIEYESTDADGVNVLVITPSDRVQDATLIYFHGGAFIANSIDTHRKLAGHLAKAAHTRTVVVEFRLAPENPFPAQLEDALAVHKWVRRNEPDGAIALAGDSGGGLLAVLTALNLRDSGQVVPNAIVALSPWLDLRAEFGDTYETNREHDAFINPDVLRTFAGMFLGGATEPSDPQVNPYFADLTSLPHTWVSVGGHEALLGSVEEFARRVRNASGHITVEISPEQQHVFPWMAGSAPEADAAIAAAGEYIRRHVS